MPYTMATKVPHVASQTTHARPIHVGANRLELLAGVIGNPQTEDWMPGIAKRLSNLQGETSPAGDQTDRDFAVR